MIQYHGTPIGGKASEAAQFLCGRHALVSFAYPDQLHVVRECSASFVVDNGAFSEWRNGKKVDVAAYIQFIRECQKSPRFDWAIIPDVIAGTEQENDYLIAAWPSELRGVPVWHLHESLERAERLSRNHRTVCIGSSGQWSRPGTNDWWSRMNEACDAFCDDGIPRCRIHGLRMLDPAIFSHLPLASADSTNCAQNGARNGAVLDERFTRLQGTILTAWRIERHNSSEKWIKKKQEQSSRLLFDLSAGEGITRD